MATTVEGLLGAFNEELEQTRQRYSVFLQKAEAEGFVQLAKLFRTLVTSETARSKLIQNHMAAHAEGKENFAVCPRCGLIYIPEAPEKCPVDDTPGFEFMKIV